MSVRSALTDHPVMVTTTNLLAVLVLYFAVPVNLDAGKGRLVLAVLVSVIAAFTLGVIVVREVIRGSDRRLSGRRLVLLLELVFVAFAFGYFVLATSSAGQFDGIATRLDALYFTATTMTTVGYGDITAKSQLARGMVTVNLGFNVVFIAAVTSLVRDNMSAAARGQSPGES